MAERELYNNMNAKPFPFDTARSVCGQSLAAILRKIEAEDAYDPYDPRPSDTFVTAINATLVWTGARTASLPSWDYCDAKVVVEFVEHLNKFSRQIAAKNDQPVDELYLLDRHQTYRDGRGIKQAFIIRHNCSRVRLTSDPPVGDEEIGRELDMYPPNVDYFASNYDVGWTPRTAFSVWEVGTEALLYAEAFDPDLLSPQQKEEFRIHCDQRLALWNSAMEKLGLTYRFYGTLDWSRIEVPFQNAVKTKKLFGKEFLGVDGRPKYSPHLSLKIAHPSQQSPPAGRSIPAKA